MLGLLGLVLLGALAASSDDGYDYSDSYDNYEDYGMDEDMYACTSEWRSLHPYDYNPYTGGYSAEEDEENGW